MPPSSNVPRFRQELGAMLRLAAPLAAAQLAQVAMGTTDTILLGSLGEDALAAGGLGANLFFTIMVVFQSGLSSVGIIVARARGAGDQGRIAAALGGGFALALAVAVLPMAFLWNIDRILVAIGEPPALAAAIGRYDRVLLFAIPAALLMGTQRAFLAAMNRPGLVMAVTMSAVVVNGLLNYGLIHGAFGLPRLGYIGSCTATLITIWAMTGAIGLAMRRVRLGRAAKAPLDWAIVRELLSLGWPIAVTVGVEVALFSVAGLVVGLFGAAALAAHQICLNVASTTFMVPLAVGQAANVRVGFHMGAGAPGAGRHAGLAAFALGVGFMSLTALAMLLIPRAIVGVYLSTGNPANADVIALVVRLLAIAAAFQVFDGVQTIAAGALRGLRDTRVPMLAAALGYWGIGFGVAWLLGFRAGMGPVGIWWGFAFGLASVAIMLCTRFFRLIGRQVGATAKPAPA